MLQWKLRMQAQNNNTQPKHSHDIDEKNIVSFVLVNLQISKNYYNLFCFLLVYVSLYFLPINTSSLYIATFIYPNACTIQTLRTKLSTNPNRFMAGMFPL